jgi:hypothetical protein
VIGLENVKALASAQTLSSLTRDNILVELASSFLLMHDEIHKEQIRFLKHYWVCYSSIFNDLNAENAVRRWAGMKKDGKIMRQLLQPLRPSQIGRACSWRCHRRQTR